MPLVRNAAREYGWTDLPVPDDYWYENDKELGRLTIDGGPGGPATVATLTDAEYDAASMAIRKIIGDVAWNEIYDSSTEYDYILCYRLFGEAIFMKIETDPFEDGTFIPEL